MSRLKVVLNPEAGRGYAARIEPQIKKYLADLGVEFDLVRTQGRGHAIELTQQALQDGYDVVVAVGGDGTSHEVVNGLMAGASGPVAGTLACIPAGSGNDFAATNGVPEDVRGACELLAAGGTRVVDVGRVTIDGRIRRYFDNTVGIGFDGLVTLEARNFKRLRGMLLFVPVVLKTIFATLQPMDVEILFDDEKIARTAMMIVVANGPREGHTFLVAPNAICNDGYLDLVIVDTMPRLSMLGILPAFMQGTHLKDPRVSEHRVRHVKVTSEQPLYLHVDGEILCGEAHEVEFEILPTALRMIGRPITE